jgi:hypothetical protein
MPDSWRRLSAHDEAGGSLGDPLLVDIRQIVDQAQSHSATGEPVAPTDGFCCPSSLVGAAPGAATMSQRGIQPSAVKPYQQPNWMLCANACTETLRAEAKAYLQLGSPGDQARMSRPRQASEAEKRSAPMGKSTHGFWHPDAPQVVASATGERAALPSYFGKMRAQRLQL